MNKKPISIDLRLQKHDKIVKPVKPKTHIKLFITKTCKFRAIIQEPKQFRYEVTIGGKSWQEGKGRAHEQRIHEKIRHLLSIVANEAVLAGA